MHFIKHSLSVFLALIFSLITYAQEPKQMSASEIELGLKKLGFLGSVLYVAAHPDDENTSLIGYFSQERLAQTAYLSMTRGDGGQNLIGPEIREYLGIIRTQELLAARRVDGSKQFFTRANDFGYSKSPEETQKIWNREQVLSDVVWTFRNFKPDVIVTRFPIDGGGTHGHHTTSAILAHEAFDLAGKRQSFPDQLKYTSTWQPKRLFLNTGRWWNTSINENSPGVITVNIGKYNPLLGKSYSEISAISRTKHKSQGFGSTGIRGTYNEFLEHRKGEKAEKDVFEGINTTWTRVKGGKEVQKIFEELLIGFNARKPHEIVPGLLRMRKAIENIEDEHWKTIKLNEVDDLIAQCMGLYLEVVADDYAKSIGEEIKFKVEAVNRSPVPITLRSHRIDGISEKNIDKSLQENEGIELELEGRVVKDLPISQPYWLRKKGTLGMYRVDDQQQIGKPENDPSLEAEFVVEVDGILINYKKPVVFKWNDPVNGEQYRPFEITPPAFINLNESVLIFGSNQAKNVNVTVKSGKDNFSGILKIELPNGWKSIPETFEFNLKEKREEENFVFQVYPPMEQSEGLIEFSIETDGQEINNGLVEIDYDHIPTQTIFPESSMKAVKLDLETRGNLIGYIHGAGDEIPSSLRNLGYEVWEMNDEEILPENLAQLDALILGIRALNTNDRLNFVMDDLFDYVENGGTLIVQYNTSRGFDIEKFAPYPLNLSRDRVSKEEAPVKILAPEHLVMNYPNKITGKDFEGWVQERGLYFPDKWDDRYTAILSSQDPGESAKNGGLLVAKYGKGYYIYTGYSWFRELPAGVPGAYKIFVNLISIGQSTKKSVNLEN